MNQPLQAYHKANDERKQYLVEINSTKGNIDGNKARQRAAVGVRKDTSRATVSSARQSLGSKSSADNGYRLIWP